MTIKSIGVIGAGQMGNGIAHVFAVAGYHVQLQDIHEPQLVAAMTAIEKNMARQVKKEQLSQQQALEAIARIQTNTKTDCFADCDLVIEAATENEAIKSQILTNVSKQIKPECILATNTSSLSITKLAALTDRPDRFMGIHFMNPVPVMELVELIRGIGTSDDCYQSCVDVIETLGKQIAVSQDFPAFIVNRVLIPMINEAIYTLYEGVGTVTSIDKALKLGANHPLGPLQLADLIGLDTCLSIMNVLYQGFSDSKYRPCPLLVKYVEAGWLGRKTGRGFYDYSSDQPTPTR